MAECPTYHLIDFVDISDMENALLLRGEINTIDSATNQANITLLDECPYVEGGGTIDVPFWYHCEDSTGTLEDLANGYKAFTEGDMVYAVFIPASGEVAQRFFIIGHVDIMGTKLCTGEYLKLITFGYVTVLDTATFSVIDINNFTITDEESPAKRSS